MGTFGLPLFRTDMIPRQMAICVTQCKRTLVVLGHSPDLFYCIRVQACPQTYVITNTHTKFRPNLNNSENPNTYNEDKMQLKLCGRYLTEYNYISSQICVLILH